MGKSSRRKKERRRAREQNGASTDVRQLLEMFENHQMGARADELEAEFQEHVNAVRAALVHYDAVDAALAIAVSDLWPGNIASPVKHLFAWAILAGIPYAEGAARRLASYSDFVAFVEALFAAWPEFPMLEDFVPEADWGQVRIRLGDEFVPMFYGSSIERTPDFVEAFRITHAGDLAAQADMDLAIAVQSHIINCLPELVERPMPDVECGHVEIPPAEFWSKCRDAILAAEGAVAKWRARASGKLNLTFGGFEAPLTRNSFGDACIQGTAFPFTGLLSQNRWFPLGIRNAPANVIEAWSELGDSGPVGVRTHRALSRFVFERFRRVLPGPLTIFIEAQEVTLPISCVLSPGSRIYFFIACTHEDLDETGRRASQLYSALKGGRAWEVKLESGQRVMIRNADGTSPAVNKLEFVLVPVQSTTAWGFTDPPKRPIRLMHLADVVTILDKVEATDELDRFWVYVDEQREGLNPFSQGFADLFASFRDSDEVLIDGAVVPTWVTLDPQWGSRWRYRELLRFWTDAPRRFPDGCLGWFVEQTARGVVQLFSRRHSVWAYSVEVAECTVQTLASEGDGLGVRDRQMLDLFMQLFSDRLQEFRGSVQELALFRCHQIILQCEVDQAYTIEDQDSFEADELGKPVVASTSVISEKPLTLRLPVNVRAVQVGLLDAADASFEIESLIEVLNVMLGVHGQRLSDAIAAALRSTATTPARYHLKIARNTVDVPEFVDPVIPTTKEYKLARRQLAVSLRDLGFTPGRYELSDAKVRIDAARQRLKTHIESYIEKFDSQQLLRLCIEQHDALLFSERMRVLRARQSMAHEVDYDRIQALANAREKFGRPARNYRYLIEKGVSRGSGPGAQPVEEKDLRELIGLVDWYVVLALTSDTLHNEIDVAGVEIDNSYLPEVFSSVEWQYNEEKYLRESARAALGRGVSDADAVEGDAGNLLDSNELRDSFREDIGFELKHLLQSLSLLSQPVGYGVSGKVALSYVATRQNIISAITSNIEGVSVEEAGAIVQFLTLSGSEICRLPGRSADESDVPFWEHTKRLHRYTIRPLIQEGQFLMWGAEHVSRAKQIWMAAVRDGYLPADFAWPRVIRSVRQIKETIEKQLEVRTEEICLRHTPYVVRGVDFSRRYRGENFEDVGDFDVLAYWPATNSLVAIECKYNQPPHSVKDSRRLRDRIFGDSETDRAGQFSRIARRRHFLATHRARILYVLKWPPSAIIEERNLELYVSREVFWWMIHPPYAVSTIFVRVDSLHYWLGEQGWARNEG